MVEKVSLVYKTNYYRIGSPITLLYLRRYDTFLNLVGLISMIQASETELLFQKENIFTASKKNIQIILKDSTILYAKEYLG